MRQNITHEPEKRPVLRLRTLEEIREAQDSPSEND